MSVRSVSRYGGLFLVLAVYGLVTFVIAGGLVHLFPDQALAIAIGWVLAAYVVAQLLKRQV